MFALSLHYQKERDDKLEKRLRKLSLQQPHPIVAENETPPQVHNKKEPPSRRISAPDLVRPSSACIPNGIASGGQGGQGGEGQPKAYPHLEGKKKSNEQVKIPPAIPEEMPNSGRKGDSQDATGAAPAANETKKKKKKWNAKKISHGLLYFLYNFSFISILYYCMMYCTVCPAA